MKTDGNCYKLLIDELHNITYNMKAVIKKNAYYNTHRVNILPFLLTFHTSLIR